MGAPRAYRARGWPPWVCGCGCRVAGEVDPVCMARGRDTPHDNWGFWSSLRNMQSHCDIAPQPLVTPAAWYAHLDERPRCHSIRRHACHCEAAMRTRGRAPPRRRCFRPRKLDRFRSHSARRWLGNFVSMRALTWGGRCVRAFMRVGAHACVREGMCMCGRTRLSNYVPHALGSDSKKALLARGMPVVACQLSRMMCHVSCPMCLLPYVANRAFDVWCRIEH